MGLFEEFREPGWNTYYESERRPVLFDMNQLLVVFFALVLVLVMIILVVGSKGTERLTTFLRLILSLHTGVVLLVCLTGQTWQVSTVHSHCEYVPVVPSHISADIGVMIGLKSVNITLKGEFNESLGSVHGEVDYNERFSFNKVRDMEKELLNARKKGLPWAILYVLEYFGVDGGGLRWCRSFREAGHFTYILLWSAFAAWCVSNLAVGFVVTRGAAILTLCGLMMTGAPIMYHFLQPEYPLTIPMRDAYIELHYGWCFWLCIVSGFLTLVTGASVLMLNWWYPVGMGMVFLHDAQLEEVEENYLKYSQDKKHSLDDQKGFLEIDTPMLSIRRRKSQTPYYNNPAFCDDMKTSSNGPLTCNGNTSSTSNGCAAATAGTRRSTRFFSPPPPYEDHSIQELPKDQLAEGPTIEPPVDYTDDSDDEVLSSGKKKEDEVGLKRDNDIEESSHIEQVNNDVTVEISPDSSTEYLDSSFDDVSEQDIQDMVTTGNQVKKTRSVELVYDDTNGVSKAIIEIHAKGDSVV